MIQFLFYRRIKLRLQMYLEKGVLLGRHQQIIFGNIVVTGGFKAKARALILAGERC